MSGRLLATCAFLLGIAQLSDRPELAAQSWKPTQVIAAPEAHQAAAADEQFVYAITNTQIARYDRATGQRLALSTGAALHLNSGFFDAGRLYCAHSNYPQTPERSEIKVLQLETMELSTFHDFGNFGGSLTWAVLHNKHWWCNFARYGDRNSETFLVEFDAEWNELHRWTYPAALIRQLGRNSLSGGLWSGQDLLVTGHDDSILFRLRLPKSGPVLELVGSEAAPFTGQGIAIDPQTGGLLGINRAKKQIVLASRSVESSVSSSILSEMQHLRSGPVREWSDFPEEAKDQRLDITFSAKANATEATLLLRQQDVKQAWLVELNGQKLGELIRDESDLSHGFPIAAGMLKDGENRLQITPRAMDAAHSDDIRVGSIRLDQRPLHTVLTEARLQIDVRDASTQQGIPCRVTLVNAEGSMPMLGTTSSASIATRHGLAYLANGQGEIQLPAGRYTIFAGRGFEYSLAQQEVTVEAGQTRQVALAIRREVPTTGYVACDTHVHTLTHSGHGDATIDERMLTIAGEGIELPIATDHNKHIDYEPLARQLAVRQHFTPVVGNEFTTAHGHFNIFPVRADQPPTNHRLGTWRELFAELSRETNPPVVILNHAQDLHSGVRPFGPKLFNAVVAEHLEDWPSQLNAMEVINSGATQTDPLQLFHNWMALLNRGRTITPIGCSDSHDVGRHFVGQARTYIRCDDQDPGQIPVDVAVKALQRGQVLVSYGLLAELIVNDRYHSGDLVPASDQPLRVAIRVLGPHWVEATQLKLFANGQLIREVELPTRPVNNNTSGILWSETWELPRPQHDVHLVAIASGPGITQPYWRTAKPYQPLSPDGATQVLGCSGAVWIDVDGDGQPTAARVYAERLFARHRDAPAKLIEALAPYDAAVAAHVAFLMHQAGMSPISTEIQRIWMTATPQARQGYLGYVAAWRASEIARRPSIDSQP